MTPPLLTEFRIWISNLTYINQLHPLNGQNKTRTVNVTLCMYCMYINVGIRRKTIKMQELRGNMESINRWRSWFITNKIHQFKTTLMMENWYVFELKLTFEMLTVRGQQHSFSTHERVFLWKCQSFWDRKCLDLRGTRNPNLRIHAECSYLLSYQGQTFAVPCFEHWLWRYRYIWSKVNIWNVNCARATNSIHFRHTNGCSCGSVKVFETENVSTCTILRLPV